MLKQMWEKLDAFTLYAGTRTERTINVRNEWGGYSRRLKMPVFTGWQDHSRGVDGKLRVLVSDKNWSSISGVNNQEHWVEYALSNGGEAAFFVIKAVDPLAIPRKVEWLDDTRVFCGPIARDGDKTFITATRQVAL
jgi:hypothetical protein